MARFLIVLALAGCTGTDTDSGRPAKDSRADDTADADADTDADTDADLPDLATFAGFVEAHAGAYCASIDTCGFLDEQGYKTKAQCIQGITDFFAVDCPDYQQLAGEICVRDDRRMVDSCETSNNGEQPLACRDVCTAPPAK